MEKQAVPRSGIWLTALFMAAMLQASAGRAGELSQVLRSYEIAPVPVNLEGKDWALVGLGSYLVNSTGCDDCHTHPNYPNGARKLSEV
jgi:hypothetical protein